MRLLVQDEYLMDRKRLPEKNLLVAILAQAVQEAISFNVNKINPWYREAYEWIRSDDIGRFSYRWICDQLDLDAVSIRTAVIMPKGEQVELMRVLQRRW